MDKKNELKSLRIYRVGFVLSFVVVVILLVVLIVDFQNNHKYLSPDKSNERIIGDMSQAPEGTIVFRRLHYSGAKEHMYDYFIMDGDGNHIQFIGVFRGYPTWSPDGRYIAVSCDDNVMDLCILDANNIRDSRTPIQDSNHPFQPSIYWDFKAKIHKTISLPAACEGLVSTIYGLESISWSPDGQKLAVLCGTGGPGNDKTRLVCVLSFDGEEKNCLDEFSESIYSVKWSPVEDILLISTIDYRDENIYLIKPDGKDPKFLVHGEGPEWSPDGQRIAFTIPRENSIAVINIDGTGFEIIYQIFHSTEAITYNFSFHFNCSYGGCGMSWSPDGNFLVFQAEFKGMGTFKIFRLDIEKGEVICLSCFDYNNYNYDPNWSP